MTCISPAKLSFALAFILGTAYAQVRNVVAHPHLTLPAGDSYTAGANATVLRQSAEAEVWRTQLSDDPNATVTALSASADGTILAGGSLSHGGFVARVGSNGRRFSFQGLKRAVRSMTSGSDGSLYVGGEGYLLKLDSRLSLVYETPVAGAVNGVAVDDSGSVYAALAGQVISTVIRLSPDGSRALYEIKLGPSTIAAIALGPDGAAYVTGTTTSMDLVVRNAVQPKLSGPSDAFAAKILPSGEVGWSTYLGGSGGEGGTAIGFDLENNLVIGGYTSSPDFPGSALGERWHGGEDGFVAWLDTNGSVRRSTYIGTPGQDRIEAIGFDSQHLVHATGWSNEGKRTNLSTILPSSGRFGLQPRVLCAPVSVTNTGDCGPGSLRAAVAQVCAGGTIDLTPVGGQTITLSSRILLSQDVNIINTSGSPVVISGGGTTRIFFISGGNISISNVTLANGYGEGRRRLPRRRSRRYGRSYFPKCRHAELDECCPKWQPSGWRQCI